MESVHILDGNNFFSRVFFAGGRNMTAIINAFIQIRRKNKGRFIVAFDTTKSERRLKLYPEYKAGRKTSLTPEEYEEFKKNLNAFIKILKNMNITVLEGNGYEADDYIAITTQMLKRFHVYIHSTDQDFLQLVNQRVSVVKPESNGEYTTITHDNFFEIVGVPPQFFVDFKAMVGDTSDNIPGIHGIGKGTATKYINEYGNYYDILDALKPKLNEKAKSKQPSKTEMKIIEGVKDFELAMQLVDLSVVYKDITLKNLVREKVENTKQDMNAVLEALTEIDSEDCFDVVQAVCRTFKN
ncbi:MAG: hypothetical protein GX638_11025 [Crenarchaeota archaeon]|jgi:DNA polymerase-1|nr:hypothetical protein [Thermoproteota archaeon]